MTDLESNIQAYRTMAEVLIGFRKIVQRGLRRVAGESWHLEACPPGVYERLVERKESELAIERLASEDDDLMGFTTFDDLAEMVEYNDELAKLLRNLAPSREVLCARLSELEALRTKLARGQILGEEELTMLTNYNNNLHQTLAGARKRAKGAAENAVVASPRQKLKPPEPEQREEPVTEPASRPDAPATAHPADAAVAVDKDESQPDEEPVELVTEVVQIDEIAEDRGALVPGSDEASVAEPLEEVAAVESDERAAEPARSDAPAVRLQPDPLVSNMESALAHGEESDVLRLLRREIISAAEAVYRVDGDILTGGWKLVRMTGWFDDRKADLGLEPLEEFYRLIEEFRISLAEGVDADELETFLADRDFSKLLLTLREVFLRNGV